MRTVRVSKSFLDAFHELLDFGEMQFGSRVVDEKRRLVYASMEELLATYPAIGAFDESLRLYVHPVARTPFVLIYDFNDFEIRFHLVVHRRADRSKIDVADVDW